MRAVTIKEAKAHLNELVEAATRGEQVVLMRGPRHVAAIVPISADELELAPRLTDDQAARIWKQIAAERESGKLLTFDSPEAAVALLSAPTRTGKRSRARKGR
jgi:prevent-host-death family protein